VSKITEFLRHQSAALETARSSAIASSTDNSWLINSVNVDYDQQHHALIDCVERSLSLLEQRHTTVVPLSRRKRYPICKVSPAAISVMQEWYDNNIDHPYPSRDVCQAMASAGHISVEQVKKWFANRRQRLGDTKDFSEIMRCRKRIRTMSGDDIMLDVAKTARFQ